MHKTTTRTKHRKRAVDTLFEAQLRGFGDIPNKIRDLVAERQILTTAQTTLPEYSAQLVLGVADNLTRIDTLISTYARDWDIDRIATTDLAAMRVAIWEMLENAEVDPRVAIDQAVTIVAMIGTDQSPSFVNAVLDKIRKIIGNDAAFLKAPLAGQGNSVESSWADYLNDALGESTAIDSDNAVDSLPTSLNQDKDISASEKGDMHWSRGERRQIPQELLADLQDDYPEEIES